VLFTALARLRAGTLMVSASGWTDKRAGGQSNGRTLALRLRHGSQAWFVRTQTLGVPSCMRGRLCGCGSRCECGSAACSRRRCAGAKPAGRRDGWGARRGHGAGVQSAKPAGALVGWVSACAVGQYGAASCSLRKDCKCWGRLLESTTSMVGATGCTEKCWQRMCRGTWLGGSYTLRLGVSGVVQSARNPVFLESSDASPRPQSRTPILTLQACSEKVLNRMSPLRTC
jgi:hypothetical protein